MTTKIFGILLLISISLFACKKTDTPQPTTQEKIIGKWKIVSIVENDYYAGASHFYTIAGDPSDYADFRSNNMVYTLFQGLYDTASYGILSDTKMWIGSTSDTSNIAELTGTTLKLYQKEIYNPTEYYESTVNFNK